jgi:hypothetical protein
VLSVSIEIRREAISVLFREDGLKPRMGLMRGRAVGSETDADGCEVALVGVRWDDAG